MLVTFAPVFAMEWRFMRLALRNRQMAPFMSVNQAISIIVVLARGLPAFEMPCSRTTEPLLNGLGAKPA